MQAKRQKAANDLHPFVRLHVHSHYGVGAADRNYCVSEFEEVDYIISEGGGVRPWLHRLYPRLGLLAEMCINITDSFHIP